MTMARPAERSASRRSRRRSAESGVQPGERLVQQQDGRDRAPAPGRSRPAAASRGSGRGAGRGPGRRDRRPRAPAPRRPRESATPCSRAAKTRFSDERQVVVEEGLVGDKPDPAADAGIVGAQRAPLDPDGARLWAEQAGQDAKQGGFAGAVGSQDQAAVASPEAEHHAIQRAAQSVGARNPLSLEQPFRRPGRWLGRDRRGRTA